MTIQQLALDYAIKAGTHGMSAKEIVERAKVFEEFLATEPIEEELKGAGE